MEPAKDLSRLMHEALETREAEHFHRLCRVLQERKAAVREKIQQTTGKDIRRIIKTLSEGGDLTDNDKALVKLWIVGDAESYARMQNNLKDWIDEFKRLGSVLEEYESGPEEIQGLYRLQGILEDARRTALDIGSYLEMESRVRRFERAIGDPSRQDTALIVKILETKLASPDA